MVKGTETEEFKARFAQTEEIAKRPVSVDMNPLEFAIIMKARAALALYCLTEQYGLNRNGVDTYANTLACLYAAGGMSCNIDNFSPHEMMAGFLSGVHDGTRMLATEPAEDDLLAALTKKKPEVKA